MQYVVAVYPNFCSMAQKGNEDAFCWRCELYSEQLVTFCHDFRDGVDMCVDRSEVFP